MNNCILCGKPAPNGLCESCIEELFKGEPVRVTPVEERRKPRRLARREFTSSILEDMDSAGWPECYQ